MNASARHPYPVHAPDGGGASPLLARLPVVDGRYTAMADLSRHCWFRVGGPAEILFEPAGEEDLQRFLAGCPAEIPLTVIGLGANLLVRDGGIPGVVMRLAEGFDSIIFADAAVDVGTGTPTAILSRAAAAQGVGGLEFLSGIPGTIGGVLRMNAGAYGVETADIVCEVRAFDRRGQRQVLPAKSIAFSYRNCNLPEDWIFTSARLQGHAADPRRISDFITEIAAARTATQPRTRTGGSTFTNPEGPQGQIKAWELIEQAECRGLRRGAAAVSVQHCNFLVNEGGATAADIEALGEEVRRRVIEKTGVALEWEIRRLGVTAGEDE